MTDPLNTLRSAAPDAGSFSAQDVHARLHASIDGQAPGRTTRRRRTTIIGTITGSLACTGLVLGLVLVTGGGAQPTPVVAATDSVDSGSGGGIQIRPASWYADKSVEAIDATDLVNTILRIESRTDYPTESDVEPFESISYLAGDGTATLDDFGDGEIDSRRLIGEDGTMEYTWVSRKDGIYTTFPWTPDMYVDEDVPPLHVQIQEEVTTIRNALANMSSREDPGSPWTVTDQEREQTGDIAAMCVTYSLSPKGVSDLSADFRNTYPHVIPGSEEHIERVCFDEATNLPMSLTTTRTIPGPSAGDHLTSIETETFDWLQATEENRALLVPNVDGLRYLDQDAYNKTFRRD